MITPRLCISNEEVRLLVIRAIRVGLLEASYLNNQISLHAPLHLPILWEARVAGGQRYLGSLKWAQETS